MCYQNKNKLRTSDDGNGNHSVSLSIILIKYQSSIFIYKLNVCLYLMILHLVIYFGAKLSLFVLNI